MMSVRKSEIPSLKHLYRDLGYETDFSARHGTLYYSTQRWSESYVDRDGKIGQSMIDWSTAKGNTDLQSLSQKFLDKGYGDRLWPTRSDGSLEYPKHRKRLVDLLAQLFWKQHTNIEKADRRRTIRQQEQHDQRSKSTELHARKVQIDAAKLCADGRAHYVVGALRPLRSNATQNLPTNLQFPHRLGQTHRTRQGHNVYDFPGSDDETEPHEHKASLIRLDQSLDDIPSDRPQNIIKLRFTLNGLQYQKYTAAFAEAPAPTANKTGSITTSVAPSNGMAKRHAPFPYQTSAANEPPETMSEHAHDSTGKQFRRKTLKGMMNISGQYKAPKSQEVENKQQPTFDVNHALVVQIPAAKANDEWHTQGRTPSGQSGASRAPSELSVDNDDEGDETYTPGKPSKAKQIGAKRTRISINKSKAAKKRRVGPKRRDDKQDSSISTMLHTPKLHLSVGTSPIATGFQAGLDNLDPSLARASAERQNPERSIPSPAYIQPEASVWDFRNQTADLKAEEQEFIRELETAISTQTKEEEDKGGDERVRVNSLCDEQKSNDCYEDGSQVLIIPKGKPILVPEESPPLVEYQPLDSSPSPWQSDIATGIKAFKGIAGIEQPLALLNQGSAAKIEEEHKDLLHHSITNTLGQEWDSVDRSIVSPHGTPKIEGVVQDPPLPYCNALSPSGGKKNVPYIPLRGGVSTRRPQNLDWMRDLAVRSTPIVVIPRDIKRTTKLYPSSYHKPATDTLTRKNRKDFVENEEKRTDLPNTPVRNDAKQEEGTICRPIDQSSPSHVRTTGTVPMNPPPPLAKAEPKIDEVWYMVVDKSARDTRKHKIRNITIENMDLTNIYDQAATEVPVGIEVRSIGLTISSYQYDKKFPVLTQIVEPDDEIGFERVKLEFIDSTREYREKGVTQYKITVEVNPEG